MTAISTKQIFLVSIHASVKDATCPVVVLDLGPDVSIHASVKDATSFICSLARPNAVSIHASVKDATDLIIIINA